MPHRGTPGRHCIDLLLPLLTDFCIQASDFGLPRFASDLLLIAQGCNQGVLSHDFHIRGQCNLLGGQGSVVKLGTINPTGEHTLAVGTGSMTHSKDYLVLPGPVSHEASLVTLSVGPPVPVTNDGSILMVDNREMHELRLGILFFRTAEARGPPMPGTARHPAPRFLLSIYDGIKWLS